MIRAGVAVNQVRSKSESGSSLAQFEPDSHTARIDVDVTT